MAGLNVPPVHGRHCICERCERLRDQGSPLATRSSGPPGDRRTCADRVQAARLDEARAAPGRRDPWRSRTCSRLWGQRHPARQLIRQQIDHSTHRAVQGTRPRHGQDDRPPPRRKALSSAQSSANRRVSSKGFVWRRDVPDVVKQLQRRCSRARNTLVRG